MEIKVVSWNIWIDGFLEKWEEFLQTTNPDIIGLQEVKDDDPTRDIIDVLEKHGYQYIFANTEQLYDGAVYRHGPALFSKYPIVHGEKIQLEVGKDERAAAYAEIDVNGTVLHVFSAHLIHTHQQASAQQEAQMDVLLSKLPNEKVIAMGDFNAMPTSATIQKVKNVLMDCDVNDIPTWSKYREGCPICDPTKVDIKLDYIFVSQDIATRSFFVGESEGSDHLPVSVIIEV